MRYLTILMLVMQLYSPLLAQPLVAPNPKNCYAKYTVKYFNGHSHSVDSDGPATPQRVIEQNLKTLDAIALTDHGRSITQEEWLNQEQLCKSFSGKIAIRGFELTGTPEYRKPDGSFTINPAQTAGWGHIVVLNTSQFAGVGQGDGEPLTTLETYNDALQWLATQKDALGIFAHPELYMTETSFDGYAPPPPDIRNLIIPRMVGCELNSAGLIENGLVNDDEPFELRSSNEACFRALLRSGWRLCAMMGGDQHTAPVGNIQTVTGCYVENELAGESLIDSLQARKTFATEVPGSSIYMIAFDNFAPKPKLVGESIHLVSNKLNCAVEVDGGPAKLEEVTFVLVAKNKANDQEISTKVDSLPRWGIELERKELKEKQILCVYAKATLKKGMSKKHIVASPIWVKF